MVTHTNWYTTILLHCGNGHEIQARWTLPEAELEVDLSDGRLKLSITAPCCLITCDGATLVDGCLVCAHCGADVHAPAIEALTRAQCPPEDVQPASA